MGRRRECRPTDEGPVDRASWVPQRMLCGLSWLGSNVSGRGRKFR